MRPDQAEAELGALYHAMNKDTMPRLLHMIEELKGLRKRFDDAMPFTNKNSYALGLVKERFGSAITDFEKAYRTASDIARYLQEFGAKNVWVK